MVIYFSGTGNSRYAAELLACQLKDDILDAVRQIKAGERSVFRSDRPWVFVAPTYSWRLPHVFEDYIRKADFSGSRDAYFILTCGDDIGNAGKYAAQLCEEKRLLYRGVLEVVMPENYIAMFNAPDAEEARRIVAKSKPVLMKGAELIQQENPFPEHKSSTIDQLKSGIVNDVFYQLFVKADAFFTTDACIGCGKCVEACPLNNIHLAEKRPAWDKNCTHCMACICGCPTEAIEYGKKSKGKPRYQCPKDEESL